MAASARAVDGRWWYTFFSLWLLGLLGFLAGPAIAFLLLFWSPFGVGFVNVASSIIFATVAPLVAIAHALLYFSLSTGRDSDLPS
jgi:hypothetical protein